jgi:hypothetical protein
MKLRNAVLFAAVGMIAAVSQGVASAADQPGQVSQPIPVVERQTILPSLGEIRAIPAPGQGRLVAYGLNVHPGARLVRRVFGR